MRKMTRSMHATALAAALTLFPAAALAFSAAITCVGGVPVGNLYDGADACAGAVTLQNIFSSISCNYQTILGDIMGRVFCSMQSSIQEPLELAMVVYVSVYGFQMVMGYTRTSWREAVMRVVKLGLIWTFATNAAYGVGIAYNFFLSAIEIGISWSLQAIMPAFGQVPSFGAERYAFGYLDNMLYTTISGQLSTTGGKLVGFMAVMSFIYPPAFAMFVAFFIYLFKILMRTIMIYLIGIGAIGFLITVGPIFMGFALFRFTFRFFDDWLRHIISFTLQIILVFACLAMWLTVMAYFGMSFTYLINLIQPVQEVVNMGGVRKAVDTWGICQFAFVGWSWTGPIPACVAGNNILPSDLIDNKDFIYYITLFMTSMCVVVYAFDALMRNIPTLSRNLASPSYFVSLGDSGLMPSAFGDGGGGPVLGGGDGFNLRRWEQNHPNPLPNPPHPRKGP